jgi:redox-sensing transcriptional repressor
VNSAQVRKDLSYLGSQGTRGVGYDVQDLRRQLREALGLNTGYAVAIVGAGNLGSALSNYDGFAAWGFEVVALFDVDEAKIGRKIGGHEVLTLDDLENIVDERAVAIGIIATPAGAAQEVADRLVAAGLQSILNFAPTVLQIDQGVEVRRVDLSTELQILTFHLHQQP